MRTERICIRLPRNLIKKLDEIEMETATPTRSNKIRKAVHEYVEKEVDIYLKKIYKT